MICVFLWKKLNHVCKDFPLSSMSLLQIICCRSWRDSFDFVTYVPMDFNFTLIFFILAKKCFNLHI